ncbi:hypothetical protein HWV07_11220 [Natronomonas salina]|uniref:hypothetical protein n=1 Tax=Natronomonas salina TaxID=1710540 RepID=UPI0015B41EE3|nr:hypothetical protein [Natronomonas salina]QLD89571.1 hypothetical protein HWV07_11220 [Natronomonas salina]
MLEYYGLLDTALDLFFNTVCALLIITADVRMLASVTEQTARIANLALAASVVFIFGSTIVLGVVLDT